MRPRILSAISVTPCTSEALWAGLCSLYEDCQSTVISEFRDAKFNEIKQSAFRRAKSNLYAANEILVLHPDLDDGQKKTIVQQIFEEGKKANTHSTLSEHLTSLWKWATRQHDVQEELRTALQNGERVPDPTFIASLPDLATIPLFEEPAAVVKNHWYQLLKDQVDKVASNAARKVIQIQQLALSRQTGNRLDSQLATTLGKSRQQFIDELDGIAPVESNSGCAPVFIIQVSLVTGYHSSPIVRYTSVDKSYTSSQYGTGSGGQTGLVSIFGRCIH